MPSTGHYIGPADSGHLERIMYEHGVVATLREIALIVENEKVGPRRRIVRWLIGVANKVKNEGLDQPESEG